ncbi:MAG TPA: MinD/ParA family protein [Bacillaceae bacterium]
MKDQAEKLRMMMQARSEHKKAKTLAVVSGKGGVGKTNVSANLAIILARKGYRVCLIDLDVGMGNVNILYGGNPSGTLYDFLTRGIPLESILMPGPQGVTFISGGNGLSEVPVLSRSMAAGLLSGLQTLESQYDFILFDMAAGAAAGTLQILLSVNEILVVATPEPTAMTDAYSMMKFIHLEDSESRFLVICNRSDNERQGMETFGRLQRAMQKFLSKEISLLGILPEDPHVRKAVIGQTSFIEQYPRSPVALQLNKMADRYLNGVTLGLERKETFIGKLRRLFQDKEERR